MCGVGYLCPGLIEDEHTCDPNVMSSDTCTIIWNNFDDNFHFLPSHLSKTIERE